MQIADFEPFIISALGGDIDDLDRWYEYIAKAELSKDEINKALIIIDKELASPTSTKKGAAFFMKAGCFKLLDKPSLEVSALYDAAINLSNSYAMCARGLELEKLGCKINKDNTIQVLDSEALLKSLSLYNKALGLNNTYGIRAKLQIDKAIHATKIARGPLNFPQELKGGELKEQQFMVNVAQKYQATPDKKSKAALTPEQAALRKEIEDIYGSEVVKIFDKSQPLLEFYAEIIDGDEQAQKNWTAERIAEYPEAEVEQVLSKLDAIILDPQNLKRPKALYMKGVCLFALEKNNQQIFQIYSEAASLGNNFALTEQAKCYQYGFGTAISLKKAEELYQKAAKAGIELANLVLNDKNFQGALQDEAKPVVANPPQLQPFPPVFPAPDNGNNLAADLAPKKSPMPKPKPPTPLAESPPDKIDLPNPLPPPPPPPITANSEMVLKLLNDFYTAIKTSPKYVNNTALLQELEIFNTKALKMCESKSKKKLPQAVYNTIVVAALAEYAEEIFSHRHKILRILADIVFVPFGILTFGAAFAIKKKVTGAATFFIDAKTKRQRDLEGMLEKDIELQQSPQKKPKH